MAEEENSNKDFSAVQAVHRLKKWHKYFTNIKNNNLSDIHSDFVIGILQILTKLIEFYNKNNFSLPIYYVTIIEEKIKIINSLQEKELYSKINPILTFIFEQLLSLKNILHLDCIELDNDNISRQIEVAQENLDSSSNILKFAKLKGLAGEFERQYKKYNKERILWFLISLTVLISILYKSFIFDLKYTSCSVIVMYVSLIIFSALYLNDTLLYDFIKALNPDYLNNIKNIETKQKEYFQLNNRIKWLFFFLSLCILLYYYVVENNITPLKLFQISDKAGNNLNTWQDIIPHLFIYIPLIWLLWFSIKQYHYTTKIMDAYKFKMALSLAYNEYKNECSIQKSNEKENIEYLLRGVLQVISEDPTKRDFKDTHMPWSEIKDVVRIFKSGK